MGKISGSKGDANKQFEKEWKRNCKVNKDFAHLYFSAGVRFMLRRLIKEEKAGKIKCHK